jgi:hypothetical protein
MQNFNLVTPSTVVPNHVMNHNGTKHYKIGVNFYGIKKRCRNVAFHHMSLGYRDYNDGNVDLQSLFQLVEDFLATNVKSIDASKSVVLTLDFVSRSYDKGFSCEQWMPFSDLNKKLPVPYHHWQNLAF